MVWLFTLFLLKCVQMVRKMIPSFLQENIGYFLKSLQAFGISKVDQFMYEFRTHTLSFFYSFPFQFMFSALTFYSFDFGFCFRTVDLYEAKNMNQVIHCIHALARAAKNIPGFKGPFMEVPPNITPRSDTEYVISHHNRTTFLRFFS